MNINAKEICKIMKECVKVGVSHFRWGDFELDFCPKDKNLEKSLKIPVKSPRIESESTEKSILNEEIRLKEEKFANLLLDDPQAYEQMIAAEELENGNSDHREAQ